MTIVDGIDGGVPYSTLTADGCCPPPICQLDLCSLICNFIQHLPSGPLWDRPKAEALAWYRAQSGQFPCLDPCITKCTTMVDHAVHWALLLGNGILGPLLDAIRESSPYTAVDTLDSWLDRLGWIDCYDCACRESDRTLLSPFEVMTASGPVCCTVPIPEDVQLAVKRATVASLHRLSLGPRRNLAALNFVLAPLYVKMEPKCYRDIELDQSTCQPDDGFTLCATPLEDYVCPAPPVDPWRCPDDVLCEGHDTLGSRCAVLMRQWEFCLTPIGETIPRVVRNACPPRLRDPSDDEFAAAPHVPGDVVHAYVDPGCDAPMGLPSRIWLNVMAAECIIRSVMPRGSRIVVNPCC